DRGRGTALHAHGRPQDLRDPGLLGARTGPGVPRRVRVPAARGDPPGTASGQCQSRARPADAARPGEIPAAPVGRPVRQHRLRLDPHHTARGAARGGLPTRRPRPVRRVRHRRHPRLRADPLAAPRPHPRKEAGMTEIDVDAYLDRIGAERPKRPDYEALCHLQERHMMTVPFETLDFTLREIPSIKDEDVYDKLVHKRRGGGCGELNSGFRMLLEALGYRVSLLGGRVLHNGKESFRGVYNGHAVLRVELEHSYLCDVGFRWCPRRPLRLDARGVQQDPHGAYELVHTPDGDVEMVHEGVTRWRVETHPRELDDFAATMWFCATFPGVPGAGQLWA